VPVLSAAQLSKSYHALPTPASVSDHQLGLFAALTSARHTLRFAQRIIA
jgi:hypothetical protein